MDDWIKKLRNEAAKAPEDGTVELWPDTVLLVVKVLDEADKLLHSDDGARGKLHKAFCALRQHIEGGGTDD